MLALAFFGSMSASLRHDAGCQVLALSPRVAELLAFLALRRGEFFTRSDIAESLWGLAENDATVASVNTALWRLRRIIEHTPAQRGDFLVVNRQHAVSLGGPRPVTVDIAQFDALAQSGLRKPIEQVTEADGQALCASVELYRNNALTEFSGRWALRERERLRNTFLDVAGRLMRLSHMQRRYGDAIRYARLVLEVDELREDIHRDLMRLLVCNGQRALALRQFESCRLALQRELAIVPMPETMALCREISRGVTGLTARVSERPYSGPEGTGVTAAVAKPHVASVTTATQDAIGRVRAARTLLVDVDNELRHALDLIRS